MINKKKYRAKLRTFSVLSSFLVTFAAHDAVARDGFGVGVIIGEPTGVSMKYWLDDSSAIDAALAVSLSHDNPFQFHADYLIHSTSSLTSSELKGRLPWYYGIGGRIKEDHDTHIGVRVPVGITYMFADTPMDFFAEVAPVLDVTPKVDLSVTGAVGLRYYFH